MESSSRLSESGHSSSDSDSEHNTPQTSPASTSSFTGKKRSRLHTKSRWQASWTKYRLKASVKGATFAHCTVCGSDFSVSSGGLHDVKRHCKTLKHTRMLKDIGTQPSIAASYSSTASRPTLDEKVITAELYFTLFIVEHNISFSSSNHFTKLCKVMFPDSEIARSYSSG